ncbi:MAG TPA: hypothetical protein DCZ12_16060, partial [Gammaproteobacteria bacterium]|nr:hypothetical protein [Gammaproteobacteria bacterium]
TAIGIGHVQQLQGEGLGILIGNFVIIIVATGRQKQRKNSRAGELEHLFSWYHYPSSVVNYVISLNNPARLLLDDERCTQNRLPGVQAGSSTKNEHAPRRAVYNANRKNGWACPHHRNR